MNTKASIAASFIFYSLLAGCANSVYKTDVALNNDAQARRYFLPKALVHLKIEREKADENVKIDIKTNIVADTSTKLYLHSDHSLWYDDDYVIEIDENGLLSAINTTTTFKGAEVVQKVSELAGTIAQLASAEATCNTEKKPAFSVEWDIDPYDSLDDINTALAHYCLTVDIPKLNKEKASVVNVENGIVYRDITETVFTLRSTDNTNITKIFNLPIPDLNSYSIADIDRGYFVTRKANMTFKGGLLTKSERNYPSEIIGFVSIPLAIIKGVSDATIGRFGFKTSELNNEKAYLEAVKARNDAESALENSKK